jgi:hypothetical protein
MKGVKKKEGKSDLVAPVSAGKATNEARETAIPTYLLKTRASTLGYITWRKMAQLDKVQAQLGQNKHGN